MSIVKLPYHQFFTILLINAVLYDQFTAGGEVGREGAEGGYSIPDARSNEEELDAVGQCSIIKQLNRTRQCITLFIRSLQADPYGNCR